MNQQNITLLITNVDGRDADKCIRKISEECQAIIDILAVNNDEIHIRIRGNKDPYNRVVEYTGKEFNGKPLVIFGILDDFDKLYREIEIFFPKCYNEADQILDLSNLSSKNAITVRLNFNFFSFATSLYYSLYLLLKENDLTVKTIKLNNNFIKKGGFDTFNKYQPYFFPKLKTISLIDNMVNENEVTHLNSQIEYIWYDEICQLVSRETDLTLHTIQNIKTQLRTNDMGRILSYIEQNKNIFSPEDYISRDSYDIHQNNY
ncbi:hypothetical protein TRFO_36732 [Tritrichomonas foetus]|uniref:Uncharacterized protein n=1 Tax=Tritrichomonas foetus TaxID=1144522 RepID=A0A1J4JDE7_9EUKA|nr:hypothetical protein TRFO_36732 [Tritrichomonas foetus]|eukprot:OHS97120.1 hypothetical protein TRFO_36732 [Tritrichomonas foetus]